MPTRPSETDLTKPKRNGNRYKIPLLYMGILISALHAAFHHAEHFYFLAPDGAAHFVQSEAEGKTSDKDLFL